jgi:hypothetical protein
MNTTGEQEGGGRRGERERPREKGGVRPEEKLEENKQKNTRGSTG